jgi:kynurenine formamidase
MAVHNLTLPLYPYMPVGVVWAWDSPFRRQTITSVEYDGVEQYTMSFHSEVGTRLMLAACYDDDGERIDDVDYSGFIDRETVVVDIPKGANESLLAEDFDRELADNPNFLDGDAVLIRTGWGRAGAHRTLGDDYARTTPHFSVAGAHRLIELMRAKHTQLMLTDCAYIGNLGQAFMYREWASRQPWDRPPFPSSQARAYLRHYTPQRGAGGGAPDWAASVPLHAALTPVPALTNTDLIRTTRVRVTILPLLLAGGEGAPCTVFAEEMN